jgi:hypothetical protein
MRRREKVERVLYERGLLVEELLKQKSIQSNQSVVSSKLVLSLIEKEKRNLVKSVKFHMQLKRFYKNDAASRAARKRKLSNKRKQRDSQVAAVQKHKQDRARELGEIIQARFGVRDQILQMNELDYEKRRDEWISRQVDEELQIDHFNHTRQISRSQRTALWSAKYKEILARVSVQEQEEKAKHDQYMAQLEVKYQTIEERKQQSVQVKQLKGEEINLRLIDAISRKQQQDRVDQARRDQISALIEQEDKRSGILKLIKQNIRQSKQLVSNVHRTQEMDEIVPLARQGTEPPGPAEYVDLVSWLDSQTGPKISESQYSLAHVPGTVDFMINHAKSIPSAYDVHVLPDGSKPWAEQPVLKWSTSKKESYVDSIQASKSELPGPATYETSISTMSPRGPKIARDIVPREDARNRQWINGDSDPSLPGPTTYTVDEFTKSESLDTSSPDYIKLFQSVISETKKLHEPSPTVNVDELTIYMHFILPLYCTFTNQRYHHCCKLNNLENI